MKNILFNEIPNKIIYLFIQNKNEYIHGREISRKLNINQMSIQNYLNALESNNILIKKKVGKSYNYKLNVLNKSLNEIIIVSEIYKLASIKEDFQIQEIIDDVKLLTKQPILIFGSYAKGYSDKNSDLDILILDKNIDMNKDHNFMEKIQSKYTLQISVIKLSKEEFKSNLKQGHNFSYEVLRNHVLVQEFEFFVNLWRKYNGTN